MYSPESLTTVAGDCQQLARYFGDRQNENSTLKPGEATRIVNALLSAGNMLAVIAKEGFTVEKAHESSIGNQPPTDTGVPPSAGPH